MLLALVGCSGDTEVTGTYTHPIEGTIVLNDDGTGTLTQDDPSDPTLFTWALNDGTVLISIDGEVQAEATADGTTLIFRPGDGFSGDITKTFTKD